MLLSRDLWMEADLRMSGGGKGVSDGDEEQRAAATTRHRGPSEGDGTEPSPPSAITHYIPNSDRRSVLADSGNQAAWAIARSPKLVSSACPRVYSCVLSSVLPPSHAHLAYSLPVQHTSQFTATGVDKQASEMVGAGRSKRIRVRTDTNTPLASRSSNLYPSAHRPLDG